MAVQLDRCTREVSPQEPDAQLQLAPQDAADIASWMLSVPGEWPVKVEVPPVESKEVKEAVDELVKLYVSKSGSSRRPTARRSAVVAQRGRRLVDEEARRDDKLLYLGEKTISRLGCFGCHTIPGFENAKPIGTALNDWGIKIPARLDFGHIKEYLTDQEHPADRKGNRDGTDRFYQEKVSTRPAWASSIRSCTGPAATTT